MSRFNIFRLRCQPALSGLTAAIRMACFFGAALAVVSGLATLIIVPAASITPDMSPPFTPGERLVFSLNWQGISAGKAELITMPITTLSGEPAYHFVLTARTNGFIDNFYKVRNRFEAFADMTLTRSLLFKRNQREGDFRRDVDVHFDWKRGEAQYTTKTKKRAPIPLEDGTFDPLSVLFYVRTLSFAEGAEVKRYVTDGKKSVEGVMRIVKREKITVPAGTYDTYLVKPDTKDIGGVFKKSKDATISLWLTADYRRLPVKIKSKVAVGSFYGELEKAEGVQ
ncbi:hypothetical protein U14_01277 [Candidatus Moduliflexus flocculans]|uniref:DUF3108 domain-containing protein n=1 Tax=Candidatus Moduliflexus flocculans TaxID=1499966 RepID=A0A0S6VVE0_9BACT|nr:hypothetical protein U14_01277 [Candidatus Moduliflexus flocculans]